MAECLAKNLVENGQERILLRLYESVGSGFSLDVADFKESIDHKLLHLVWRKGPGNLKINPITCSTAVGMLPSLPTQTKSKRRKKKQKKQLITMTLPPSVHRPDTQQKFSPKMTMPPASSDPSQESDNDKISLFSWKSVKKRKRRKHSSNYYASPPVSADLDRTLSPVTSCVPVHAELCETNSIAASNASTVSSGAMDLASQNRFACLVPCPDSQDSQEASGALSNQIEASVDGEVQLKSDTKEKETESEVISKVRDPDEQDRRGKCNELIRLLHQFRSSVVRQDISDIIKNSSDSGDRHYYLHELYDNITNGFPLRKWHEWQ